MLECPASRTGDGAATSDLAKPVAHGGTGTGCRQEVMEKEPLAGPPPGLETLAADRTGRTAEGYRDVGHREPRFVAQTEQLPEPGVQVAPGGGHGVTLKG